METNTNAKAEARNLIARVTASLREDIATIDRELDAPVMVGSPFVLVLEADGGPRVFGEWEPLNGGAKVRGWIGASVVPASLCGVVMLSESGVARNRQGWERAGMRVSAVHFRQFLATKRAETVSALANAERLAESAAVPA
jgi:hypothetical protein